MGARAVGWRRWMPRMFGRGAAWEHRPMGAPEAEVELSVELVRSLLAEQHPDLAHLPLTEVASGWDNVVFRLGDDLAVRVPRRWVRTPVCVR